MCSLSNGLPDTRSHFGSICGIANGHSGTGISIVNFNPWQSINRAWHFVYYPMQQCNFVSYASISFCLYHLIMPFIQTSHIITLSWTHSIPLQAGTQFWDEKMEKELAEGHLSSTVFDRYIDGSYTHIFEYWDLEFSCNI